MGIDGTVIIIRLITAYHIVGDCPPSSSPLVHHPLSGRLISHPAPLQPVFNLYAGAPGEIKVEDIRDVIRWSLGCQEAVVLDPLSILARGNLL